MNRSTLIVAIVGLAIAAIAVAGYSISVLQDATAPTLRQTLLVTACPPETFVGDDCTTGAPDPAEIVLTDNLVIPVAGRVCNDETVSYDVTVRWVSVDTTTEFTSIDVPVTYDQGCNPPYGVPDASFQGWSPPPEMLEAFAAEPAGTDLGRWRIVGTADPVRDDTYATYQWDSVKTFSLVKG